MGTPVKVVITGAAGRMGRMLVSAACAFEGTKVGGATEIPGHKMIGEDAGTLAGQGELGVKIVPDLKIALEGADVVVDFTSIESSPIHAGICAEARVPIVIGTTGLPEKSREEIAGLAGAIPIVMTPNMSVGVNLLFHLVDKVAGILGEGFDVEIVETHHRMKKDSPSGTACRLGEIAAAARGYSYPEDVRFERHGIIGERPVRQIGIQTLRGGDVVGEHTVMFAGEGERIELIHRAHGRNTFAMGAMRAAVWVASRGPGLYDMSDVLGLKEL